MSVGFDVISDLALVEENGEKLNMHELVATCVLLLNAGHEASVNAFGNGTLRVDGWDQAVAYSVQRRRPGSGFGSWWSD